MAVREVILPAEAALYCPKCKQIQPVQANMYNMEYAKSGILVYSDHCEIDWNTMDISGDFEYVCDMCGNKLAADLEDLHKKIKEEK